MQVCSDKSLAYRSRYYHDIMAVNNLSKGEAYYKLPDSYVIFICLFDPYGKGASTYNFKTYDDVTKVVSKDGRHTICFNLDKVDDLEEGKLKELMKYIANKPSNDDFVDILDKKISKIKNNDSLKIEYMFFNAELADERAKGIDIGIEQGIKEGINKGIKEGISKGIKEGISKGKKEGIKEGKKEGREETIKEIAITMQKEGNSLEFISKIVKLSIEEVNQIIKENKN